MEQMVFIGKLEQKKSEILQFHGFCFGKLKKNEYFLLILFLDSAELQNNTDQVFLTEETKTTPSGQREEMGRSWGIGGNGQLEDELEINGTDGFHREIGTKKMRNTTIP